MNNFKSLTLEKKIDLLTNEIGRIILLNGNFSKNLGLFYGVTGAAIFLYNLDKWKENAIFYNYANDMIMETSKGIDSTDVQYINGSAGVVWGINYLSKNNFIEIPDDLDLLKTIDYNILKKAFLVQLDIDSFGISSYFYQRLQDTPVKNQDDIEYMLKLERFIAQIDMIHNQFNSTKLITLKEVFDAFESNGRVEDLAIVIETICNSVTIVRKASLKKVYPEIAGNLVIELSRRITNLLNYFYELINNSNCVQEERYFVLWNLLCKTYNAYLQLSELNNVDNSGAEFLSAILKLKNKHGSKSVDVIKDAMLHFEMSTIPLLFRINSTLKTKELETILEFKIENIVNDLCERDVLIKSFILYNQQLNLGVSGLGGLGLILLQWGMPEIIDWDECLLIN